MGQITDNLKAAWSFIDSPEKWCQGTLALDKEGTPVHLASPTACRFCSVGALVKVRGKFGLMSIEALSYLDSMVSVPLEDFNDSATYDQVKSLWLSTIAKAEAKGL